MKKFFVFIIIATFVLSSAAVYAQEASSSSDVESMKKEIQALREKVNQLETTVAGQAELINQQKQVLEKIMEKVPEIKVAMAPPEPKTLVKTFVLDGVNLFKPKDFEPILTKYRNKELGMSDLKKISDEISAFYRKKGYVNSMAYVPTQEITDNTVEIKVAEARVGDIDAEKPKYSKRTTVKKRFLVEKGQILDAKKMEVSLKRINKNQDRIIRAVLLPGKTPETSDILLKVEKERKPYHFYTEFNNRGTNLTGKGRWGLGFVDTNVFGLDDALSLKFMANRRTSEVYSFSMDYNLPVTKYDTRLGIYAAFAKADIGGQFAIISPEGKARVWGLYVNHPLFEKEFVDEETSTSLTLASNVAGGFDSVSVRNKILGNETSHDEIRAFKGGINFDEKDSLGRTVLSTEIRAGIPDFLGSMKKRDDSASRIDAGGEFQRYNIYASRITRLPLSSVFINTLRLQYTDDALVNPEQMVLGGADTVRGFPENDYLADYGWIANMELRTPAFLIPPILRVPFDKKHTRLIDAIQFVGFLDAGKGHLNKARVGEKAHKFLVGAGFGLRFEMYERLRARIDFGFPVGNEEPSDHSAHTVHVGLQYEW